MLPATFRVPAHAGHRARRVTCGSRSVRSGSTSARPDDVPAGENALPRTVQGLAYLGETIHVRVALANGQVMVIALRNEGQLIKPLALEPGRPLHRSCGAPRTARCSRDDGPRGAASCVGLAAPGIAGRAAARARRALWLFAFFLLPVLILLAYSFMPRGAYGGVDTRLHARALPALPRPALPRHPPAHGLALAACAHWCASCWRIPLRTVIARSGRRRNLLLFLAVLPFWTSSLVRTYAMIFLLRDSGLINRALIDLGLIHAPLRLLYTEGAVLAGLVYGALPFMILPIYASLEKLDPALLEAAEGLGARPWARFARIVWPLTLPGVAAGSLLVFVPSLGSFVVPDLLGGARHMMIGNLIQNQFGPSRNWPFGSAAAFAVMALVMIAMLGVVRVNGRDRAETRARRSRDSRGACRSRCPPSRC